MDFVCEFCGHSFSRETNLLTHKRTAKYCLVKQGIQEQIHKCAGCDKGFGQKNNLQRHQKTCIPFFQTLLDSKEEEIKEYRELLKEKDREYQDALDEEIQEYRKRLEEKDDQIRQKVIELAVLEQQKDREIVALGKKKDRERDAKIAELEKEVTRLNLIIAESKGKISVYKERPGVINNTQYINPKLLQIKCDTIPPLTIENVKKEIGSGKYTYDNFIRGESGLVDFIATLISDDEDQRSYVCTDAARNNFHRLIETREWENDNGATFLNKILDQLCEPAKEYYGKVLKMTESKDEGNRDLGEFLMEKTKPIAMGITCPKSKDRNALFNKIRTEVRKLASV